MPDPSGLSGRRPAAEPVEPVLGLAGRAYRVLVQGAVALDYNFHRFVVQAALTKVMHWLSVCARRFQTVGERSHVDIDQFVAFSLAGFCFKLSNAVAQIVILSQQRALALGGLKALILHGDQLSPEMRELNVQFIGRRRDLRLIHRIGSYLVGGDCLSDSGKQGQYVHMDPRVVDETDSPDSMGRR